MGNKSLCLLMVLSLVVGLAGCGGQPTPAPSPTETTLEPTKPAEPTAEASPQPAAAFEQASCPFNLPEGLEEGKSVECGYLLVPEDRSDPNSRTLRLAVAILRHPDGNPKPDPILYLEGGPGGSRLELMALTFQPIFEPMFAANRDLIVFDQRGVGLSEPALDCPDVIALSLELLDNRAGGKELTDQEIHDLMLDTMLACGQELQALADLEAYNSAASAADVNDLRLALGYDQVNLWGLSYGTRLALEVMRSYPEGVRSVVLDSTYPPDVDLYVEAPVNADRAFDVLFEGCAADEACNSAYPDLRTVFFDTVDRLEETPATFQVTNAFSRETYPTVLDGDSLMGLLFQFLYETEVIPSLPKIIYDASQGNFDVVALLLGALLAVRESVSDGMQFSVQCHEELAFSSLEEFEAALANYPELEGLFENAIPGRMSYEVCAGWNAGQAEASANEPVNSDIPTLILSGEYDPITPPAWAERVGATLESDHLFEYPGVGHGVSVVAGCPKEMMLAFLKDPSAAPDNSCMAEMGPPSFVTPGGGAEPIDLAPFSSTQFGIQGVVPAGWREVNPGVFARQGSGLDVAVVIAQAAPMSAEEMLQFLTQQLGVSEAPGPVGQREANGLTWTLYATEVQGIPVDMALAESDGLTLLVLLQSPADEHEALYQSVFLPVVDAEVPLQ